MRFFSRKKVAPANSAALLDQITLKPASIDPPTDRDVGWEYLYFAAELKKYLDSLRPHYLEISSGRAPARRETSPNPAQDVRDAMHSISTTVGFVDYIFQPEHVAAAFGGPNSNGDAAQLSLIARQISGVFANLVNIVDDMRSASFGQFQKVANDVAESCLLPLQQIQAFGDEVAKSFPAFVDQARRGTMPTEPVTLTLKITMDEEVSRRLMEDIDRVHP
jgi:hypothetical protein